MRRGVVGAIVATSLAVLAPGALTSQERSAQSSSARIVAFTNEPREPEFGAVFELEVQVRVAPDVVAFLGDTMVDASNAVSAGPGSWTVTVGPADSIDVRATYPVMGFLPGGVELPFVELWTRRAGPGESPGIRSATELGAGGPASAELEHALLYLGGVFVMPPSEMVGDDAMLLPRPPADVVGGERSWWLIAALGAVGLASAVIAWQVLAGRLPSGTIPLPPVLSARAEALRELDRIRDMGWHTNGRVVEFYDATTGVLRHYAERRDPTQWSTALTSTELLASLRERAGAAAVEPLAPTVWTAECVKFGGRAPGADAAEEDWSRVRAWISGEAEG